MIGVGLLWAFVLLLVAVCICRAAINPGRPVSAHDDGLREATIADLRKALRMDVNLAALLRCKMEEDNLTLTQASELVRAGYRIPVPLQYLDVWDKGLFSDDSLNDVLRKTIARSQRDGNDVNA